MMNRTLLAAALCLVAGSASADPYEVRFRNSDPVRTMHALRIHMQDAEGWIVVTEIAADCAPLALCSAEVSLLPGHYLAHLEGRGDVGSWSIASNVEEVTAAPNPAVACMAPGNEACRSDYDGDGEVTASDFGTFLGVYGRSWFGE